MNGKLFIVWQAGFNPRAALSRGATRCSYSVCTPDRFQSARRAFTRRDPAVQLMSDRSRVSIRAPRFHAARLEISGGITC